MTDASPCSHLQFFGAREFCPDCGLSRTEALVEACAPFLKDDETPAECIVRNRRDVDGCLTMLIDERRKVESLRSRLAEAEQWIRNHPPQYGGDHACAQCYPHSDVLVAGFICAYHRATASADVAPKPGVCRHCGQYLDRRGKCRNPEHSP